jgi:hypothetical protein
LIENGKEENNVVQKTKPVIYQIGQVAISPFFKEMPP